MFYEFVLKVLDVICVPEQAFIFNIFVSMLIFPHQFCRTFQLGIILLWTSVWQESHMWLFISTSSTNTECLSLMFQTAERVLTARTEQFMTDLCLLECIQFGWLLIIILWSHSPPKWKCRFQSQMLNKDKTGTWYFSMFPLMILDHPD